MLLKRERNVFEGPGKYTSKHFLPLGKHWISRNSAYDKAGILHLGHLTLWDG